MNENLELKRRTMNKKHKTIITKEEKVMIAIAVVMSIAFVSLMFYYNSKL